MSHQRHVEDGARCHAAAARHRWKASSEQAHERPARAEGYERDWQHIVRRNGEDVRRAAGSLSCGPRTRATGNAASAVEANVAPAERRCLPPGVCSRPLYALCLAVDATALRGVGALFVQHRSALAEQHFESVADDGHIEVILGGGRYVRGEPFAPSGRVRQRQTRRRGACHQENHSGDSKGREECVREDAMQACNRIATKEHVDGGCCCACPGVPRDAADRQQHRYDVCVHQSHPKREQQHATSTNSRPGGSERAGQLGEAIMARGGVGL
mmetsp:Transcript_2012/g.8015  ORF Transcript_2012/g.8015 Transcript_2012/m.8015 type:complete len:271 (-) Transcript_2012:255-1067(-)